jgi:HAD superfamily hydrolase (TIGR01490 family)
MSLVLFDLDGTIVKGQSQLKLLLYLRQKKLINSLTFLGVSIWFVAYRLGLARNPEKIMRYSYKRIGKGVTVEALNASLEEFYEKILAKAFHAPVVSLLRKHQETNDEIVLLTNVLEPLARVVAQRLGISKVLATELEQAGGVYTGTIKGDIVYGENKVKVLERNYKRDDLKDSYAYTDHPSDAPLLRLVTHPFVVGRTGMINPYEK